MSLKGGHDQGMHQTHTQPLVKLPFIISTTSNKADPVTRKLIRSHVMRGKNRIKPSKKSKGFGDKKPLQVAEFTARNLPGTAPISTILSSRFSGISFAADVEPALIDDVLLFASISSEAMFLLNRCIKPPKSDAPRIWFAPMLSDAAYLYAACFTTQTFFDGYLARTRSAKALQRDRVYYDKTLKLLRERLLTEDDNARLSESTIMTVLTLSGHAYSMGDFKSATNHVNGLLKLVSMKGVDTLFHNTRILIEIIRSDLGMAVDKGTKPVLFTPDNIPWPLMVTDSLTDRSNNSVCLTRSLFTFNDLVLCHDYNLSDIWSAILEFCNDLNAIASGVSPPMSEETYLHSMGAIMYRLLNREFTQGSLEEAVRLGLLAFVSPIFLNWNRVELADDRFNQSFQDTLTILMLGEIEIEPQIRLWLLMIYALSASHDRMSFAWLQPRMRMTIDLCNITEWAQMKELLSSFLWVGMVYDQPGREIFDRVT